MINARCRLETLDLATKAQQKGHVIIFLCFVATCVEVRAFY